MEWTDTAVVLKLGVFRERDMWLKLLTREHGVVSTFAFGGKYSKRRFSGCLDLLNRLSIHVQSNRTGQYLNLSEGNVLKGPHLLRNDISRLGLAINCMKFIEVADSPPDAHEEIFELTNSLLDELELEKKPSKLLATWFRLKVASIQGYTPDFLHCSICGINLLESFSDAFWRQDDGLIRCADCCNDNKMLDGSHTFRITPAMAAGFSLIMTFPLNMWNLDGLAYSDLQTMAMIADNLVEFNMGLAWSRSHFVHV